MADNVTVINNSGNTGTDYVVETDDIGSGVETQIVGLRWGAKDATTRVTAAAPLPVVQTGTPALPTGAATEATIAAILAKFPGAALVQGHGTAAAALRVELPTDGTGVVGLNAGANIIGSLTANQSVNVAQVAGTTTDTNSGVKSAGTQRFVIATDQPQLTNALKVDGSAVTQPVSGTVTTTPPSNATTNVTQFGGTNVSTGTGVGGAGIPRVTVSSDSVVGVSGTVAVSGTITTTPPANATTNVTQFGGNNVVTGTGSSGVGIPRVTVAQDSTITAAQGTAGTVGNKWPISVTDGTFTAAVKNGNVPAAASDSALVVAISPNNTIPVSGTVTSSGSSLVQGTDGVTSALTAFVQALDGKNTLFTENPQERRLLEQILLEIQAQNQVTGISPGSFMLPPSKPDPLINGNATSITAATTVQTLAFVNVTRSGLSIYNSSTSILYLLAARTGTVSSTLFTVQLNSGDYWEAPQGVGGCYKGLVTGVWVAANGSAMVTEYTA